ncbi:gpn-loop gtpase 1 [Anaeramoeba flamelloides]|uniref:Gpn-loop gtpase 1 n=1 Tax=Anaeramoeba flamelloides TaxID=1746091 RepID=A0ABQ8Y1V5_9EUKA|nr:gpn-loop gtpase 1 [Anaeramoeba flamelloides]
MSQKKGIEETKTEIEIEFEDEKDKEKIIKKETILKKEIKIEKEKENEKTTFKKKKIDEKKYETTKRKIKLIDIKKMEDIKITDQKNQKIGTEKEMKKEKKLEMEIEIEDEKKKEQEKEKEKEKDVKKKVNKENVKEEKEKENENEKEEKEKEFELNEEQKKAAPVIIVIGFAGSGKTTLIQRLNSTLHMEKKNCYVINLDSAVQNLPYGANIDIRDTINYKQVMKKYRLGPNGAIITSLNLFSIQFDQVLKYIKKRKDEMKYILIDTPGQIETFLWSASGQIIMESLAAEFPTIVTYVVDTPRITTPTTFMSNMLYTCSILYKTCLPFLVVFNKTDVTDHSFALEWMKDWNELDNALDQDKTYSSTLARSLSLVLEEFYETLKTVGVSSVTGKGMDEFFEKIEECKKEYFSEYLPIIEKWKEEQKQRKLEKQKLDLEKLEQDLKLSQGGKVLNKEKKIKLEFDEKEDKTTQFVSMKEEDPKEIYENKMFQRIVGSNEKGNENENKNKKK